MLVSESYFCGKSHFEDDGTQNYLGSQPVCRYFKKIDNTNHISSWKSKGLSNKSIKPPVASNNNLASPLNYIGVKTRAKFNRSCLKQDKATFTQKNIVNIYIVYEFNLWDREYNDYPVLKNHLFGAVRLAKNANIDQYKYSGYGIGFDRRGTFPVLGGSGKSAELFVLI